MKNGITLIGEERAHHSTQLGFDNAHDDALTNGELVDLAEHYLDEADPADPQRYGRKLVKAASALAAEIDRLVRASGGTLALGERRVGVVSTNRGPGEPTDEGDRTKEPTPPRDGGLQHDPDHVKGVAPNTPPAEVDHATKVQLREKATGKRTKATAKSKAKGTRPRSRK